MSVMIQKEMSDYLCMAAFFISNYKNGSGAVSKISIDNSSELKLMTKQLHETISSSYRLVDVSEVSKNPDLLDSSLKIASAYFDHLEQMLCSTMSECFFEANAMVDDKYLHSIVVREGKQFMLQQSEPLNIHFDYFKGVLSAGVYFCYRVLASRFYFEASVRLAFGFEGDVLENVSTNRAQINRTINFKPEYKQSGISILSYFSEIVQSKYPDLDISVTIEQEGNTVRLIIETPEGEVEKIEKELTSYGMVVARKKSPDEYMPDRFEAMRLANKIDMAELEIRHTKSLLESERNHYGTRIKDLEKQLGFMQNYLDRDKYQNIKLADTLADISSKSIEGSDKSLQKMIDLLRCDEDIKDVEVTNYLAELKEENPTLFERVSSVILKAAVQGAVGNGFYAFLINLSHRV
jgi:hypothetical protein